LDISPAWLPLLDRYQVLGGGGTNKRDNADGAQVANVTTFTQIRTGAKPVAAAAGHRVVESFQLTRPRHDCRRFRFGFGNDGEVRGRRALARAAARQTICRLTRSTGPFQGKDFKSLYWNGP
jgi:hypothetical protein